MSMDKHRKEGIIKTSVKTGKFLKVAEEKNLKAQIYTPRDPSSPVEESTFPRGITQGSRGSHNLLFQ